MYALMRVSPYAMYVYAMYAMYGPPDTASREKTRAALTSRAAVVCGPLKRCSGQCTPSVCALQGVRAGSASPCWWLLFCTGHKSCFDMKRLDQR